MTAPTPQQMVEIVAMARERVEREWQVREISDDGDTVLYLADKDYANLGDIAFEGDGQFIGTALYAIVALHQQVEALRLDQLRTSYIASLAIDALNRINGTPTEYAKDEKYKPITDRQEG